MDVWTCGGEGVKGVAAGVEGVNSLHMQRRELEAHDAHV